MISRAIVMSVLVASSAFAQPAAPPAAKAPPARASLVIGSNTCRLNLVDVLPVAMEGLKPIVPGTINGAPVKFILATGRGSSWISSTALRQFKLATYGGGARGLNVSTAHGEVYSARGVLVPTVTVGPFRRNGGSYLVSDSATAVVDRLTVNNDEVPGEPAGDAAGWMGQDWFHVVNIPHDPLNLVDVEYDLGHGAIRFFQPQGCARAALAYWTKNGHYSALPMDPRDPASLARVNGAEVRWAFATELGHSYMTLEAAARAGLKPGGPGVVPAGAVDGFGTKPVRIWIGTVSSLKIGDEVIPDLKIRFGDIGESSGLIAVSRPGLFLGSDFFLSHRVLVSTSQLKIYIARNEGPAFGANGRAIGEGDPSQ